MKNIIPPCLLVIIASQAMMQQIHAQDAASSNSPVVVAGDASNTATIQTAIAAVIKTAAAENPSKAGEMAEAVVKALGLKSNNAADEALIESVIQAAIEGSQADANQAKSIREISEAALLTSDGRLQAIQGGDVTADINPLNFPGINPHGNPLASFTEGGTGGGNTGGGAGVGGNGIGSLLGNLPAGALPGGFFSGGMSGSGFNLLNSADIIFATSNLNSLPVVTAPSP